MQSANPTCVTKLQMFTTYDDGRVVVRYFDDAYVAASWVKTMKTLKMLGTVERFSMFSVRDFPPGTVVIK